MNASVKDQKEETFLYSKWKMGWALLISTHRAMYLVSPCGECLIHTLTGGVFLSADFTSCYLCLPVSFSVLHYYQLQG